jgi:hypothetical protein
MGPITEQQTPARIGWLSRLRLARHAHDGDALGNKERVPCAMK